MGDLIEGLGRLVGTLVAFKYKAHGYHWNVEGDDFPQFHALFESIYEDVDSSSDPMAENIRKLDSYAPFKLTRFVQLSEITETDVTTDPKVMSADLLVSNEKIISMLMDTFDVASSTRQQGVANFLAERIDAHQKWSWQLRVIGRQTED